MLGLAGKGDFAVTYEYRGVIFEELGLNYCGNIHENDCK